jgi:hypothetical protein
MRIYEIVQENSAAVTAFMKSWAQNAAARSAVPKAATRGVANTVPPAGELAQQLAARSGLRLAPIPANIFVDKKITQITTPIVNYSDRAIVVVQANGQRIPFYLSSGQNAKAGVVPGQWYPIFGIGANGWINKGSAQSLAQYYGSAELRSIAAKLDSRIGDIRDQLDDSTKFAWTKSPGISVINQGLNPVNSGGAEFVANAMSVLKSFNGKL